MLRFLFILLVLFGVAGPVWAQHAAKSEKRRRITPWTIDDRFALSLAASSLLDPYGALAPVGLGYYFGEKFSLDASFGFPLYYVLNNYAGDPRKTVNSDYKLRAGVRQYFRLREHNRCFFGAEVAFRRQEMYLRNSYLHFTDGSCYDYSGINAAKTAGYLGAFAGIAYRLNRSLLIEGYLGLGGRLLYMKTDLDTRALTPRRQERFSTLAMPNGDRVGDRDINIYLPFAIKIAYLL